jgi:hypothetical protein
MLKPKVPSQTKLIFMRLKSDIHLVLPRIPVLLWTLAILSPLCCSASDFLKVDGESIRDNFGEGKAVHLYGTNLGGWRLHEPWMSPLAGASNEWDARNILTDRFGKDAVWDLYNAYWDSWITEIDFKNLEYGLYYRLIVRFLYAFCATFPR